MSYTDTIIEKLNNGERASAIATDVGCHVQTVYRVARKYKIEMGRMKPVLQSYDKEVRKMRADGRTTTEIAEQFGVSVTAVKTYCRNNRIPTSATPGSGQKNGKKAIEEKVSKATGGCLEYVGGYVTKDSKITVRCKKCGQLFERSFCGICSKGHTSCPACKQIEAEQKAAAVEEERKRKAEAQEEKQKKAEAEAKAKEDARWHDCPVCGKRTNRPKYCSDKCQKKSNNKRREIKRRRKIQQAMIDNDITVPGLYKRDAGICYICGRPCRLDDYTVREGTKICGDWYPSIDHVVPLSKGGEHSWDNVKLAHRICNSRKSDR